MKKGTLLFPEDSATVFVWLQTEINGSAGTIQLSDPGINGSRELNVSLPLLGLVNRRLAVAFEYPMGLDFFIFGSDGTLLGLPRTTSVTVMKKGNL